jgi:hypothetical protein
MNSATDAMPASSVVSRGAILNKLLVAGYLTAIAVATIGWVSAFGWITVRMVKWFLA